MIERTASAERPQPWPCLGCEPTAQERHNRFAETRVGYAAEVNRLRRVVDGLQAGLEAETTELMGSAALTHPKLTAAA